MSRAMKSVSGPDDVEDPSESYGGDLDDCWDLPDDEGQDDDEDAQ